MACSTHNKYQIDDIESIHHKFQNLIQNQDVFFEHIKNEKDVLSFLQDLLTNSVNNIDHINFLKRKYRIPYKNSTLLLFARTCKLFTPEQLIQIESDLRISRGKSHSGVLVITIFTSAYPEYVDQNGILKKQAFSCKWNCHYCPNEPGQPRSYLQGEPGVLRANSHEFDCCRQMWSRMESLYNTGHPIDKLEVLVLGGTWESYPLAYRNNFIRDMYYAANTFWSNPEERRIKGSLAIERDANRDATCKVIGLTLETRPDTIDEDSIKQMRYYGCTRIQLGIQHLNDSILEKINRQCPTWKTIRAIQLLKDWGYKIDAHWMPNLPSSNPDLDKEMFLEQLLKQTKPIEKIKPLIPCDEWLVYSLARPDLQMDQWKIYPCEVVPFTEIEKWYREGSYIPYGQTEMTELLMMTKKEIFPWIRLNRVIRDIPSDYIMASGDHPSLRQELLLKMKKRGWKCNCIRCREIKGHQLPSQLFYRVYQYQSSGGTEYFIACEDESANVLCGFVRLRINEVAWIRELHVYGQLIKTISPTPLANKVQSIGIGRKLMTMAEEIIKYYNIHKVLVIAGEGTKRYYEKLGYHEGEYGYMVKLFQ
jgi:ELP3 family radical SAM enzyme/protein acetyltransferase